MSAQPADDITLYDITPRSPAAELRADRIADRDRREDLIAGYLRNGRKRCPACTCDWWNRDSDSFQDRLLQLEKQRSTTHIASLETKLLRLEKRLKELEPPKP